MGLNVEFDGQTDELTLASITSIKKLAARVKQYQDENVLIVGPLDASPLKGQYASLPERSLARAETVP